MAGVACKTIINNQTGGLSKALEEILKSPLVRGGKMIPDEKADEYLQRLVDIDLYMYLGEKSPAPFPEGGLAQIVVELEEAKVFTSEVWEILRHPDSPSRVDSKHKKHENYKPGAGGLS